MGADGKGEMNIAEAYGKAGLYQPQYSQYDNEYEK